MGRARALAAYTEHVDVVAHQVRHVDQRGIVRKRGEADLGDRAIQHAPCHVDRIWRPSIRPRSRCPCHRSAVVRPRPQSLVTLMTWSAPELAPLLHGIAARVPVRSPDRRRAPWPPPRRAGRSDRGRSPLRSRRQSSPPSSVRPYIDVPAVTTSVASSSVIVSGIGQGVDIVDRVFGKSAVGGEAVGPMALVDRRRSSARS